MATSGKTPTGSVKIAGFLEGAAQTIQYAMLRGEVA